MAHSFRVWVLLELSSPETSHRRMSGIASRLERASPFGPVGASESCSLLSLTSARFRPSSVERRTDPRNRPRWTARPSRRLSPAVSRCRAGAVSRPCGWISSNFGQSLVSRSSGMELTAPIPTGVISPFSISIQQSRTQMHNIPLFLELVAGCCSERPFDRQSDRILELPAREVLRGGRSADKCRPISARCAFGRQPAPHVADRSDPRARLLGLPGGLDLGNAVPDPATEQAPAPEAPQCKRR